MFKKIVTTHAVFARSEALKQSSGLKVARLLRLWLAMTRSYGSAMMRGYNFAMTRSKRLQKIRLMLLVVIFLPHLSNATSSRVVTISNNLYNQVLPVTGNTISNITANYYNGATKCDSKVILFRTTANESIGTGNKCTAISSVQIVAGTSANPSSPGLQVYSTTPVVINLPGSDSIYMIIVQNNVSGSDGSSPPVFNVNTGLVSPLGILGYQLLDSLLWEG